MSDVEAKLREALADPEKRRLLTEALCGKIPFTFGAHVNAIPPKYLESPALSLTAVSGADMMEKRAVVATEAEKTAHAKAKKQEIPPKEDAPTRPAAPEKK